MDEEKDLSSSNELEDTNLGDNQTDADVGGEDVDGDASNIGNGYNGLAHSNREAYARGLSDDYNERIARNRANVDAARARAANPNKMKKGHEDEEESINEETGEILESTREYYNRDGEFKDIPDKYPCVIYFGIVDYDGGRSYDEKLNWIYIGE